MIFGFSILFTAILLSAVAAYYSVAGLTAIFSAATIPVIIMGGSLELGKIVATVWLHNNWRRAGFLFKAYLVPAVMFLMLLTSMGIFGYLSKAHSDQSLVSGDAVAKVAIYDEKIKTAKDNIDANRKALKQMDEAVDQVMGRSNDEKGAEKSVAIRRSQQKERARLQSEIAAEQKTIGTLNEEVAPLRAEFRKVESEVGPIKYIAALVYGDNPDANILEKAVRLVIIMIVLVFDPLALTLILAANKQFQWAREGTGGFIHDEPAYPPDDGPISQEALEQLRARAKEDLPQGQIVDKQELFPEDPHPPGWMFEKFPYLTAGKEMFFKDTPPMVAQPNDDQAAMNIVAEPPGVETRPFTPEEIAALESADLEEEFDEGEDDALRAAIRQWKAANPEDTLKNQRLKLMRREIAELPWMGLLADNESRKEINSGFGTEFPKHAHRGDTFVRVDRLPSVVYKYNGKDWMEVDKNLTDSYTYDIAYIDHLIERITSGEYDAELLSETEREQVAQRLQSNTNTNT
jgi:hypothetical protein